MRASAIILLALLGSIMGTAAASSCCMVIADSEETCPDPLVQSEASAVGTHEHNGVPFMSCCEDPTVMAADD